VLLIVYRDVIISKHMLVKRAASRAKMMAVKSISKLRGQTNHTLYPQPEGQLGECMTKYGKEMGEDSLYGMFTTFPHKLRNKIKKLSDYNL